MNKHVLGYYLKLHCVDTNYLTLIFQYLNTSKNIKKGPQNRLGLIRVGTHVPKHCNLNIYLNPVRRRMKGT